MRTLTKPVLDLEFAEDITSSYKYWKAGKLWFCYTSRRAADGKFYAWIEDAKRGTCLKIKAFGKKKDAIERARRWYQARAEAIGRIKESARKRRKPEPTKEQLLLDKVKCIQRRLRGLDTKMKRLNTAKRKAIRSLKYHRAKLSTFIGGLRNAKAMP